MAPLRADITNTQQSSILYISYGQSVHCTKAYENTGAKRHTVAVIVTFENAPGPYSLSRTTPYRQKTEAARFDANMSAFDSSFGNIAVETRVKFQSLRPRF